MYDDFDVNEEFWETIKRRYVTEKENYGGEELEILDYDGSILKVIEQALIEIGEISSQYVLESLNAFLSWDLSSMEYNFPGFELLPLVRTFVRILSKIGDPKATKPIVEIIKRGGGWGSSMWKAIYKLDIKKNLFFWKN
ncbi:MAG: hypothetical protein HGN29_08490 [Asgard group archaeon]|nr:hypothetical protein [Asgard group archaeon]